MKITKLILLGFIFASCLLTGQNINYVEYYFDDIPGLGNANFINISQPASDITLTFQPDLTGIDGGFHTLYVRSRDENGKWTVLNASVFYIDPNYMQAIPANIVKTEYYIDHNPGLGNGIDIPISPSPDIEVQFAVNLNNIGSGFHTLYIRAIDEQGRWGNTQAHPFLIDYTPLPAQANISLVKYSFIAGVGDTTLVANLFPNPSNDVTISLVPELTVLSPDSSYTLRTYATDENGKRSIDYIHEFVYMPSISFGIYSFEFDSVMVGDSSSFSIPLYAYEDSIDVNAISVAIGEHFSASLTGIPLTINKGDSIFVSLNFKPISSGTLYDTLLVTNSSNNNPVRLFLSGNGIDVTAIGDKDIYLPTMTELKQNYPNPFNPSTTIVYHLPVTGKIILELFDINGRKVKSLIKGIQPAGVHKITFNADNIASGIYVYKLQTSSGFIQTKKLIIMK